MKFIVKALALVTILSLIALLLNDEHSTESAQERATTSARIIEVGYFKSSSNARLFTLTYPDGIDLDGIEGHAKTLSHTAGKITAAYYYRSDASAPGDIITTAGNWDRAQAILWGSSGAAWDFVYFRYPSGIERFVNCRAEPNDLCRK